MDDARLYDMVLLLTLHKTEPDYSETIPNVYRLYYWNVLSVNIQILHSYVNTDGQ